MKPFRSPSIILKNLDNLLHEKFFKNKVIVKNAFKKEFLVSKTSKFYAIGINKLMSCLQKRVN